jgi:hypothetical protein
MNSLFFEISHRMSSKKEDKDISTMRRLFGVELSDFQSWSNFVKLMNRPEDPSSLAVLRILFGMNKKESELMHVSILFRSSDMKLIEQ